MTSDRDIGDDVSAFFNLLTGYSEPPAGEAGDARRRSCASACCDLIDRESERAEAGLAALIMAKMNSLGRRGHHPRALRGGPRRRQDPAQRARHLLPAPGRQGRRATSRSSRSSTASSSTRASSTSATAATRRSTSRAPTGCRGTSTAGSSCSSRSLSPEGRQKALAALDAAFADNVKARRLQAGRLLQAAQARARRGGAPLPARALPRDQARARACPRRCRGRPSSRSARPTSPRRASRSARYVSADIAAASGIVRIQAQTIRPATPHFTAESRFVAPTPTMAPVIVCVVETGIPESVAPTSVIAPEVSAQKPPNGCSFVIFVPIVFTIRQPPNIVPRRDRRVARQDDPERDVEGRADARWRRACR